MDKMTFKPMLYPADDPLKNPKYFEQLQFPLLGSPKLDGIRCIVKEDQPIDFGGDLETSKMGNKVWVCKSRKFIDLPSLQVQTLFSELHELDGELIVGNETDHDVYNRTQSYVMSDNKPAEDISFRVFDYAGMDMCNDEFELRLETAQTRIESYLRRGGLANVSLVEHEWLDTIGDLLEYETKQLELGYEGVMLNSPFGPYKHGRITFKEGNGYKLKRFQDDEAVLMDVIEEMENTNVKEQDAFGNAKRSTAKVGLVPANTTGRLVVKYKELVLEIACGVMKHDERLAVWCNPHQYIGRTLTFRHFAKGVKELPRFPRFVGWRSKIEL